MTTATKCPFTFTEISKYFVHAGICSLTRIIAENLSTQNMWSHLTESERAECSAWIKNHFAKKALA